MHIRSAAAVLCDIGDMADAGLSNGLFAEGLQHSHRTPMERWQRAGKFSAPNVCGCHGRELCRHHRSRCHHGDQVWSQSQGRILLPGPGIDYTSHDGFVSRFWPPYLNDEGVLK